MRHWVFCLCAVCILLPGLTRAVFIQDRQKLKIRTVRFEGNETFRDHRLHRVMLSRPSSFLNPSYYYPEVLKDDLESLQLFYHQTGFLDALITDHTVAIDSAKSRVDINIVVQENERTYLEGLSIFGNRAFSEDVLMERVKLAAANPLELKKIEDGAAAILRFYADHGYLDANIKPDIQINPETQTALVDFMVAEGPRFRIGEIHLSGLEKTKPGVVLRELSFKPGQILNYTKLLGSQRKLYLTGLFQSVFIRPETAGVADSAKKNILVELKESDSGSFNAAAGYGSIERARGRLEFYNTNLKGTSRKFGFSAKLSSIIAGLEASFTEPWTLGTPWVTDVNLVAENQEEPGYNLNRYTGRITFSRKFLTRSSAKMTYRIEDIEFTKIKALDNEDQKDSKLNSLTLTLIYDTRDNLFNASRGIYFDWSNEWVRSLSAGGKDFFRSIVRFKYFLSYSRSTVFGTSMQVGWIKAAGNATVPLNERFYAGGPNSLRGFGYQKVGPLDQNRTPLGGKLKVEYNLEARQVIYKILGGVLFFELGNVWSQPGDFKPDRLRADAGVGLRLNTPIGLARVDYGFNLNRKPGEDHGKLYFSMGHAF